MKIPKAFLLPVNSPMSSKQTGFVTTYLSNKVNVCIETKNVSGTPSVGVNSWLELRF